MAIRAIEPLDPALRHAQTPAVLDPAHQYYEWFYFEVDFEDEDGHPWRIISSFHYPHGLDPRRVLAYQRARYGHIDYYARYGDHPGSYAGLASYVVDVKAKSNVALIISRFRRSSIGTQVQLSAPGAPLVHHRFGRNYFKEISPGTFELFLDQRGIFYRPGQANRLITLELKVKLEQNTPGFQPPGAVLLDQSGVQHSWACVMPNPKLTVEHVNVRRARRVGGFKTICHAGIHAKAVAAYHDHQWGDDLLYRQIRDWSWGRFSTTVRGPALPRDKVLFFDVNGIGSPTAPASLPHPILVEVPGDGTMPEALAVTPNKQSFRLHKRERMSFADGCRLGIQGQRIPYYENLNIRGQTLAGALRNFDVIHRNRNNVDAWPFYLRFMPEVDDPHGGVELVGISEYMRADRLAIPVTQRLLALSDRMTYLE